jgi:hypothetical protein
LTEQPNDRLTDRKLRSSVVSKHWDLFAAAFAESILVPPFVNSYWGLNMQGVVAVVEW